jgi:hypothetical protein
VLPTLWFRNTWSYELDAPRPSITLDPSGALIAEHAELGTRTLAGDGSPDPLFCENETNFAKLFGATAITPYPKDGINDHVVSGTSTVNLDHIGTKAALHYRLTVGPGQTQTIRVRLRGVSAGVGDDFDAVMATRKGEADAFYAELTPTGASGDEALVMRQAFAGMLWSKQFFHYDVRRWLDGDPAYPPPPPARDGGRNHDWAHLNNRDVVSMPDKWEYPWYASWDLAFHCVALAHVDPEFAKSQLILLCREWYMHPNGQLPAYEWNFGDVNPPVQAWAALRIHAIAGDEGTEFLERILHKLLLNFTWWVNRKDAEGNNLFEGGFLGLDNVSIFDRSVLPVGGLLEQSDATAWMAMYCADMLELAVALARANRSYEDLAIKFFEHFALIAAALAQQGLWDEQDGFFYDVLRLNGASIPLRGRSVVGLLPLAAVTTLGQETLAALPDFAERVDWFTANRPEGRAVVQRTTSAGGAESRMLSIVDEGRLRRLLGAMLDPEEFLSDHGLRSLSRRHRDHPLHVDLDNVSATLDYEPAESTTGLFGGNSNWRGPVWFPINYLLIGALRVYHGYLGSTFTVPCPLAGGGTSSELTLGEVADELSARLIAVFCADADGVRPVFGTAQRPRDDDAWRDLIPFHEYFDGDTGAGLGASHQTGWTGLVANLIIERGRSGG